jgi:SAM-dependent methyltransferase
MPLRYNKVCEYEDFADADLAKTIREVFPHEIPHFSPDFPKGAEYRKYWEVAMSVRALSDFGALRPDARLLGIGAGTETTIFYLANSVGTVFATDLYLNARDWGESAPWRMLVSPDRFAPYPYRRDRLVVQHMDARLLGYPDDWFDGIFSSSSLEHFGSWESIATAAYEMGRVLRPGGVLTIATEYLISGPSGGDGWDGMRFFSRAALDHYIVEASGLEPADELSCDVSERTLASERSLLFYSRDWETTRKRQGRFPRVAEVVWSHYPHLVLSHRGYTFGSVHLTLRKSASHPCTANEWARPSPRVIADVEAGQGAAGFNMREHLRRQWIAQPISRAKVRLRRALHRA